jgi:thiol reductant ABC exporter CydC subunit
MTAIVAVRAFGLSKGGLRYLERLAGHDAALRVLADLRIRYYARLARLSPAGLGDHRSGDLVERLVSDLDAALDVLVRVIVPYAVGLGVSVGSVTVVATLSPATAAALVIAIATVAVGLPTVQAAWARRADGRLAPIRGEMAAYTVETLQGLADLTANGAVGRAIETLSALDERQQAAAWRSSVVSGVGSAVTTLATGGCVLVGLASGTFAVRAGTLPGELLAVVVLVPIAVFESIAGLPLAAQRLVAARAALARVAAVFAATDPTPEPVAPIALPDGAHTVALRNVTASWTPGQPAVRNIDLELRPGARVALVGASGSGKSTIAALLVRFLDPEEGSVTIDSRDLRDLPTQRVREVVCLCDDEAYLFDSTIEVNLRVGCPDASADRLRAVLADVRLLDWVDTLPKGLSTPVGEHGILLSGGQRRRLALARALLADSPVLVLDEPTEHLDESAAAAVVHDLLAATSGRTTLLITHRPLGLDEVDEIVTLEAGRATRRRRTATTELQ